MNIIVVDDEYLTLTDLEFAIRIAAPEANVTVFESSSAAAQFGIENHIDIAYLDINMPGLNGIELAKKLRETNPEVNIIFVTGYDEYAKESYSVQASDYLTKPISSISVAESLKHLRVPVNIPARTKLRVQCFGNFDVFADDKIVYFQRQKSKELLAYLIHKRGTSSTTKEICAVIYENDENISFADKQIQPVISTMMKALRDVNAEDVIIKNYNNISINTSKVDCDFYRYIEKDPTLTQVYLGEYMSNYTWAEFRPEYLERVIEKEKS